MSKNTSISLGEHFNSFIEEQIASGRFASASEVIRTGLRLLEDNEAKLAKLREALQEGLDSGPAEPFDLNEFLAEMNAEADAERNA
jgi:antitoxin ParD1/3/4